MFSIVFKQLPIFNPTKQMIPDQRLEHWTFTLLIFVRSCGSVTLVSFSSNILGLRCAWGIQGAHGIPEIDLPELCLMNHLQQNHANWLRIFPLDYSNAQEKSFQDGINGVFSTISRRPTLVSIWGTLQWNTGIPNIPSHWFLMFLGRAVRPMAELMTKLHLHRRGTHQHGGQPYLLCLIRNLNHRHERELQQVYTIQAFSRTAKKHLHLAFSSNQYRQLNSKPSPRSP